MRENLAFFLLLLPLWMLAQTEEAIKYEIISEVVNKLLPNLNCGYYNSEKPIDPEIYELHQPDSIYTFIDFETYEEYSITGAKYDSIYRKKLPALIADYQQELKRWRIKEELGKKVMFVGSSKKSELKAIESIIYKYTEQEDLLRRLIHSKKVSWDVANIANKTEYILVPFENKEKKHYKYAYAGTIWFSDVMLNKEKNKAILQMSIHYKISENGRDGGATGFGGLLFLEKREEKWQIDKSAGLWEE